MRLPWYDSPTTIGTISHRDCRAVTLWQPVTPLMDTLALGKSVSPSIVELAGVEPASKQLTKVLSTCLVSCWLSGKARKLTSKLLLILLILQQRQGSTIASPKFRAPRNRTGIRHLHPRNVPSPHLVQRLSISLLNLQLTQQERSYIRRLLFWWGCLRDSSSSPGMLTNPLSLLSKPSSPNFAHFCISIKNHTNMPFL